MSTIAEENKKILRQAMDVVVGGENPQDPMPTYEFTGYYSESSGILNADPENITLMDLSGGGFLNDGRAEPLSADTPGYLSVIGQVMRITLTGTSGERRFEGATLIGLVDGKYKRWRAYYSGDDQTTLTIPKSSSRIRIMRLVPGPAIMFNKASLIDCTLQLRSVETTADNPELQLSEIEFSAIPETQVIESGTLQIDLAEMQSGTIYYTAGYPGDMSPVRKFYVSEIPTVTDGAITFRGEDATRFLPESTGGVYVGGGYNVEDGGGARKIVAKIHEMLEAAGIDHDYNNFPNTRPYNGGANTFISNDMSPRAIIAHVVNILCNTDNGVGSIKVNYVDAGRPRLWVGYQGGAKTLKKISRPQISIDPLIGTVKFNDYLSSVLDSEVIETINVTDTVIRTTSKPYYDFTASSGRIEKLSHYSYKLTASGSVTVRGHPISLYGFDDKLPYVHTDEYVRHGKTITVPDVNEIGSEAAEGGGWYSSAYTVAEALLSRENILYTFDYRGDPNLQPRDYIRVDVKGNGRLTDMTIDHIEIRHENGGMISTITAREGFI